MSTRIVVFLALVILAGCSRDRTEVDRANRSRTLLVGNGGEPGTLDPHTSNGNADYTIINALLEGLVTLDPKTLVPQPGAADRWEISGNGLVYTFHLRAGNIWSNGDAVVANDFLFSFQRILSPDLASDYQFMLFPVKGARAYARREIDDFKQVGFAAPDSRTVVVTLDSPTPYFLNLVAHITWLPVHPPTIEHFGKIDQRDTAWTKPGNFVGNGPFTLTSWSPNNGIRLKKNPRYWDAEHVMLDEIQFLAIDNADAEERMFRAGQLHITQGVPRSRVAFYKKNEPALLHLSPYFATAYFSLNTKAVPLNDVRVRRALALAIDRDLLSRKILKGVEQPAFSLTPPACGNFLRPEGTAYDPGQARRLLDEAGYADRTKFPVLKLMFNAGDVEQLVAEAVQEMWRKELEINVSIITQDDVVRSHSMHRGEYEIGATMWVADFPDPQTFLQILTTHGGYNYGGYSNREYDRLVEILNDKQSPTIRQETFVKMEKIITDEAPLIPLYHLATARLQDPSVQGYQYNPMDLRIFKGVSLSR